MSGHLIIRAFDEALFMAIAQLAHEAHEAHVTPADFQTGVTASLVSAAVMILTVANDAAATERAILAATRGAILRDAETAGSA